MRDLAIAVITRGTIRSEVAARLATLHESQHLSVLHVVADDRTTARNRACRLWQQDRMSRWLLLLDEDVVPPEDVATLIDRACPVIAGDVPRFRGRLPTVEAWMQEGDAYRTVADPFGRAGVLACDGVGAGCLLLDSVALRDAPAEWQVTRVTVDGIAESHESVAWCAQLRAHGIPIHVSFDHPCDRIQPVSLRAVHAAYSDMVLQLIAQDRARRIVMP